ncbi:hypothetical protein [Paucibacter soli]|uniref:hypothetical protein n=1 Tax=Paucibacter soli TaxID=3133433 RepID=UPI0030B58BB7
MMVSKSPFVVDLLSGINSNEQETSRSLAALAVDTVRRHPSLYALVKSERGTGYVMTRSQVVQFLFAADIERWGRAVWLTVDPVTKELSGDIPLNHGVKQRNSLIETIAKTSILTLQINHSVAHQRLNGEDHYGFRISELADLLDAAHAAARGSADWIDPAPRPAASDPQPPFTTADSAARRRRHRP